MTARSKPKRSRKRDRLLQIRANPVPATEELPSPSSELGDDLLVGAAAIAAFVFGSEKERRRVYYMAEINELPCFQLGTTLCARRSTLMRHIAHRERLTIAAAVAAEGAA